MTSAGLSKANLCVCLVQIGVGPIPDSVLMYLENHKDLSVATEMLSDRIMILLEKGVINNRYQKVASW